jgi:membrane protein insertase, YidC/Oxa1 family, C-terminal domain
MNIFDIINVPLGYLIKFCYMIVPNYAIALLLFAIIIKVILFPLGIKQQKNSVKQASLKPKEMAIRARYAGRNDKATQQKVQEEVMKLYQSENFNPMGGCLPMLIEMPIIFALYGVVNNPLKYLCSLSAEVIEGITAKITELGLTATTQIQMIHAMKSDFGAFASIVPEGFGLSSLPNFNVIGSAMDLSLTPSFTEPSLLLIIPVLVFVSQFASTKLIRKFSYTPAQTGDAGASMKIMEVTMPLMGVFFSFSMPSVIGLYWIYQSLISIVRQIVLAKMFPYPKFTEEDYKEAEREMNGKLSKKEKKRISAGNPNKTRSLHRIDDEEDAETEENDNDEENTPQSTEDEEDSGLIGKAALKEDKKPNENKKKEK